MKTILTGAIGLMLAGCAGAQVVDKGPLGDEAGMYWPVSFSMEATEGDLVLTAHKATFAKRKGSMDLRYARQLDADDVQQDSWFGSVGGPDVYLYEVTNAVSYHEANKEANGIGDRPVRWLAVSPMENGDLSLCEVVDEKGSIAPDRPTVSACGSFSGPKAKMKD